MEVTLSKKDMELKDMAGKQDRERERIYMLESLNNENDKKIQVRKWLDMEIIRSPSFNLLLAIFFYLKILSVFFLSDLPLVDATVC